MGFGVLCPPAGAQGAGLGAPEIAARAKGPDQINLTWRAAADPGYGYLVEVQSAGDRRYTAWTELEPIPRAGGYTCDSSIVVRDGRCNISDPGGEQVYNPSNRGVPYWVTEAQYTDPQDGTAAQFIAWGLKPHTTYRFRVRSYSGDSAGVFSTYSNEASETTSDYAVRYVSPLGKDANDGTGADGAHAWRTLAHGAGALGCGQVLVVMGGAYPADEIRMTQKCSAAAKAVVLVNPGETATITSQPANSGHALALTGEYLVIDGLGVNSPGTPYGEYDAEISGSHNALLNVEIRPPVVPSFKFGVAILGWSNLVYRCYLHDYGSPDATQNPDGGGGFVLSLLGAGDNVIWSNHLTRGGHDESLCKSGCQHNRWLNNVMDGGWGQGWVSVDWSNHNLVEGNVIQGVGQLTPAYKPAIQVSSSSNTVRRNVTIDTRSWGLEVSAQGVRASYNLIYDNLFYNSGGCYFQSSNGGPRAYDNVIYANNICYRFRDVATRIYLGNATNRNTSNDILAVNATGLPQPDRAVIGWNELAAGTYDPKPVAVADRSYGPVFTRNKELSVIPRFVDEAKRDFHLSAGSPLLDAGIAIVDAGWGSTAGPADLGAYGIVVSNAAPPADRGMERARAGDYAAAIRAVREHANMPHAAAIAAALERAAYDDAAAAEVLGRMAPPGGGDLVERYERVRQGALDPALWDLLAANPERLLEMADLYIQWGLVRDALVLVTHKYAQPVPALNNALMLYYRSYCRDLLDYAYYAAEDMRVAGTLPTQGVVPRFAGAEQVFQLIVQRNPTDAHARILLALAQQNAGGTAAAREALDSALKLRPGLPEAEAALAKLGPEAATARKYRPAGKGPAPEATPAAATASPKEIAATALGFAASGDIGEAMSYFTPAKFPQPKQEEAVREAYIELRLRRVVAWAAAGQCAPAIQGLTGLEAEDKSLPFTAQGFGAFTRGIRVQYWVGVVEYACTGQNEARRRWEVLAKANPELASTDYAYPFMATAKLDPALGKTQARKALVFLERQMGLAPPEYQGAMFYSRGLLQTIAGRNADAAASFRAGAAASSPGMVEYLNLAAIRMLETGQ
jgi:tetratricopeptide (TPR) repeat protein